MRYVAAILLSCHAHSVLAQTDEIQVYDAGIAAPGTFDLTWHNNYEFSASGEPAYAGGPVPRRSLNGAVEWAYGVTEWFEAGLYFPLYSVTGDRAVTYNGMKLRSLFVVPNASTRRFFYGVNFEFSRNTHHWDPKVFTAEIRPIVGWRFGNVDLIVNPILDYTSAGVSGLHFAPATRLAYRFGSSWSLAAEEYAELGPVRHFLPGSQQSHELFSVLDHSFGELNIEIGMGFGLTSASDHRVLKLILNRALSGG